MSARGRVADRLLALGLLLFAGFAAWQALALEVPFAADPIGPKAFPVCVAIVLAACAALIAWRPETRWEAAERVWPGIVVTLAMTGYALGLTTAGFIPATAILCAVIALAFEARPLPALAVGLVTAPALWLLLDRLLDLPLPRGVLGL